MIGKSWIREQSMQDALQCAAMRDRKLEDVALLPSNVPNDPKWQDVYHLTIAPPNVAFEMVWPAEDPLRILYFSRGDWEAQLLGMAG